MQKLKDGQRFSEVATAYSEDKARQGVSQTSVMRVVLQDLGICYLYTSLRAQTKAGCGGGGERVENTTTSRGLMHSNDRIKRIAPPHRGWGAPPYPLGESLS